MQALCTVYIVAQFLQQACWQVDNAFLKTFLLLSTQINKTPVVRLIGRF